MLFSTKNLMRLLWVIIIILAFVAGYLQSALELEQKKTQRLEKQIIKLEQTNQETEL
jgi:cell division protein FtsL